MLYKVIIFDVKYASAVRVSICQKKAFSSNDICSLVPELNDDATSGGL